MQKAEAMAAARRWKILISAPRAVAMIDYYRQCLEAAGCEVEVGTAMERLSEGDLLPLVGDVDGMICGDDQITTRVLDAAPRLRVISKWGTGIDSIDVEDAKRRGIAVCNTPGAFSEPVADTVLGYILLFARKLDRMAVDMQGGLWQRLPLHALGERTLGIIGLGDCGRAVARRAKAFGMKVISHTVDPVSPVLLEDLQVQLVSLETVLAESDYVTLHPDLRAENRHMIDSKRLRLMKPEAVLINTARGQLVDEGALVIALREKWIAGAALDVFECEPLPAESPLRRLPNVYLAPHNANASPLAAERVHSNSIRNLLQVLGAAT